jgi:environmental stress-induced protein Ves
MDARIIAPSDHRTMPWKNGHGITHEIIALRDAEDSPSSFVVRLSIAEIAAAAPFSAFPGCDRTILLLSGDGMVLSGGPRGEQLLDRPFQPYEFQGEWPLDCRLLGGPCRDFNIMVDRRRARAFVKVMSVIAPPQRVFARCSAALLFALSGHITVEIEGQAATLQLLPEHALWLASEADSVTNCALKVRAQSPPATALFAAFTRTPRARTESSR